jgi:hypothetical protein
LHARHAKNLLPASHAGTTGDQSVARRFMLRFLAAVAVTVAGCGLLNAVVDPYGLHRWVDRPAFNTIKPRAAQVGEAFKYRAVEQLRPATLLLGNSRAEMGWDPQALPASPFAPVVNGAMPGRGLEAMLPLADHAWSVTAPALLFVGLEFFDCLEAAPPKTRAAMPPPPAWSVHGQGPLRQAERLRELAAQTLSLDATVDSVRTLWGQGNPNAAHLRRDGFQTARDYPALQAVDGAQKMFLQRDSENARARANAGAARVRHADGSPAACFDAVDALLEAARVRGQRVVLASYPYHARLLETIVQAGLWAEYETWKTMLVERVELHRSQGLAVVLRDFGAYHPFAIERVPPPGAGPVPRWYWESGHFRAELGTGMLAIMTGQSAPDELFGVELRSDKLQAHLAAVRTSRRAFASQQPDVVSEMRQIVARACAGVQSQKCRTAAEDGSTP